MRAGEGAGEGVGGPGVRLFGGATADDEVGDAQRTQAGEGLCFGTRRGFGYGYMAGAELAQRRSWWV